MIYNFNNIRYIIIRNKKIPIRNVLELNIEIGKLSIVYREEDVIVKDIIPVNSVHLEF